MSHAIQYAHLTIVSMHFHNLGLADLHVFFACIYNFMLLELQQNFSELLHKLPVHTYNNVHEIYHTLIAITCRLHEYTELTD